MDYLRRRELRWQIPLKWWFIYCLILSTAFYVVAAISTIALASVYGTWIEGNPIMRMSFDNLGLKWGLIELGIIVIESIVVVMIFFLTRKDESPFLLLFSAHFFLITSFFISLNDFSYIASGGLEKALSFFRIFGIFYPLNIFVFLVLGFTLTLILTTDRKNKKRR